MDFSNIHFMANSEDNKRKLGSVQDITSLSLGVGAGILAPEPIYGFLFYVIGYTLSNLGFYLVCSEGLSGKAGLFFKNPIREIFFDNVVKNLPEFIMMWCLIFALVK